MSAAARQMPLTILDTQLVQSTLVASATLLIYDYLCTFDRELAYVWTSPSQWSAGTSLFFINRYLPFVDTFMSLRLKLTANSPETCRRHFQVITWFIVCGIIISELILLLRTYAIWERKRFVFITLCISSAVTFTSAIVATDLEVKSISFVASSYPGCHIHSSSSIIIVAYIALAVSETTMAVLTGLKAYRHMRHAQSRWVIQLYRDGLLFYVYLITISTANVAVPLLAPPMFANWLATPQRVLHSILGTRVLLLILQQRAAASPSMTYRRRGAGGLNGGLGWSDQGRIEFGSSFDDGMSTNMTIAIPAAREMDRDYDFDVEGQG